MRCAKGEHELSEGSSGSTSALQELIMHAEMKRNAISAGVLTQDVGSCFTGSMRRRKHVVKACS